MAACAFAIMLLATADQHLAAQEVKLHSAIIPDGAAAVGPDWAELVFPPLELSNTGCARTYDYPPAKEAMRIYYWGAQTRYIDAFTGPTDHFTTLDVRFELPARVPITDARLDSALAVANLDVLESRGEPPTPRNRARPTHAWARRKGRSVRIRIEGKEAVAALLRPRGDSIDLNWCRRDDSLYVSPRRTRIVGGVAGPPKVPVYTQADSAAAFAAAVDAIFADDSATAHNRPPEPKAPRRPDSPPDIHVQIGKWSAEAEWTAPTIARVRSWPWRALRWTADSARGFREVAGGRAPNVSTAYPSLVSLGFYFMADTVQMTEYRLFLTCEGRPRGERPIWYMEHLLAATPSGWREIRTKSAMATTYCN